MKVKSFLFVWMAVFISFATVAQSAKTNFNSNSSAFYDDFKLGQPASNVRVGISKKTPPSSIFVCLFYVGQTNSDQMYIAPPQFQRVEYFLFDSSNKAVPYLATYNPPNKKYKKISEVPKNVFNVHEGTMFPPFTMPYDQIFLTNIFQITHRGDYKVVVRGRIMRINDDSSLGVITLPPVSLTVHLGDRDLVNKPN